MSRLSYEEKIEIYNKRKYSPCRGTVGEIKRIVLQVTIL